MQRNPVLFKPLFNSGVVSPFPVAFPHGVDECGSVKTLSGLEVCHVHGTEHQRESTGIGTDPREGYPILA